MASENNPAISVPSTVVLFATQLTLSTIIVGFTNPHSWTRPAALPVLLSCIYGIVTKAPEQMRTRWCGLVGGLAYLYLLQYIDVALLTRWSYETHGDNVTANIKSSEGTKTQVHKGSVDGHISKDGLPRVRVNANTGFWPRLSWGWSTMLSFRHSNTPYEIRNVPPFKGNDPTYVPSRRAFVTRQAIVAVACYLTLDLLDLRTPPTDVNKIFNRSQIPVFSRFSEITGKQWQLRVFSTFGFAVTFFCIIQGFYSTVAVVTVGLFPSDVASWRPVFGSLSDAYTLRNFWGKFWHQSLRQNITSPARWLSQDVLKLPHGSLLFRLAVLALAFLGSGVMHLAASLSSGVSGGEIGIFHFFLTHVCGILVEDQVQAIYRRLSTKDKESLFIKILVRALGYVWVVVFMVWTDPAWIYPIALKPVLRGPPSVLPFSIVKTIRSQEQSR